MLTKTQTNWRLNAVLGKQGTQLFKLTKGLGTATSIAAPIFTGMDMYQKAYDNDPKTNVTVRDKTDLAVGGVGAVGGIGASLGMFGIYSNPIGENVGLASLVSTAFRHEPTVP
ncbi:MAG: hypothetical protein ACK5B9_02595 [Flavobacteriia bacterium]|jgi:hypothetical protein